MNINPLSSSSAAWPPLSAPQPKAPPAPVTQPAFQVDTPSMVSYRVDEGLGRVVVSIIDGDSGEVIRQIPSNEMLAFFRRMKEFLETQFPANP